MKELLNNLFKIIIICISILGLTIGYVYAEDESEYGGNFLRLMDLSIEDKGSSNISLPFAIQDTRTPSDNPVKLENVNAYTGYEEKFCLRDYIPNNVTIKDQRQTATSWAFSSLATLESNLALRDYRNGDSSKIYNFSERHLNYATSKTFRDNNTNPIGFNREVHREGNFLIAQAYLTNGTGAVLEADMPFENNNNTLDISEIQNKPVQTQVYDTVYFPYYLGTQDTVKLREAMKNHLVNYGAISATIYGDVFTSKYYNERTSAIFCNNEAECPNNHYVTIIGWDDKFSDSNFGPEYTPIRPGAWIIANTIGPDVGDEGYMYVSYEDVNIYKELCGIIKADSKVSYDNIYQYDMYGASTVENCNVSKVYLGTRYRKVSPRKEYITGVSIFAPETYTCRVFVNPNGEEITKNKYHEIELKEGSTVTVNAGYHVLEFLNPVEITGDNFTIMIEAESTRKDKIQVAMEKSIPGSVYECATAENGKCFMSIYSTWRDAEILWKDVGVEYNADLTIKAFTTVEPEERILKNITISKEPYKTNYIAGQNFDKTGMVVLANYSDNTSEEVRNYVIQNGENLKQGQNTVRISFQGKIAEQAITVSSKQIESISISRLPNKIQYIQNKEYLDLSGGYIKARYNDNSEEEILMKSESVSVQGFTNRTIGVKTLIVKYINKTATFDIEIIKEPEVSNVEDPQKPDKPQDTYVPSVPLYEAENSSFTYMKSTLRKSTIYSFSEYNRRNYNILEMEITDINRTSVNDSLEYYYYLSSSRNERNITNWVRITERQLNNNRLDFTVNTNNISNYAEVSTANDLYLYIKEVAIRGQATKEFVTQAVSANISSETIVEVYVDGVRIVENGNNKNNNNNNTNDNNDKSENKTNGILSFFNINNNFNNINDNVGATENKAKNEAGQNVTQSYVNGAKEDFTTSNEALPKAGKSLITFAILATIALGITMYIKYERIDK